jgi:trehalose-phosphatase
MDSNILARILRHLHAGGGLVLFLDYDGTLVPIARTPAEAQPDGALLALLADLARAPAFDTIVLSGRPLSSLQAMLPVPGLTLAGTYGVEIRDGGHDEA